MLEHMGSPLRTALPALSAFLCRPFAVHIRPDGIYNLPNHLLQASWVEGGWAMTFEEILDQALAMLQRRRCLTYGTLKRQFQLDDAALEDLKDELIYGQRLAVDEDDRGLVLRGETLAPAPACGGDPLSPHPSTPAQPAPRASAPARLPLASTPAHLAEKILLSRSAL